MGHGGRRALSRLLLLSAAWLPLQAPAAIHLRDDRGVAHVLAQPPRRIVSLLPSLTESVCMLGGCDKVVGVDRFSNSPPQVASLPKVGGLEDAQLERIVALKPDVVLAGPSSRVIGRLESLGVPVVAMESKTHADVRRTLVLLGQMMDRPGEAQIAWSGIEAALTAAAARVPAALRGQRVYFEIDSTPYAAGAASFIGETLARLGLGNVVPPGMGPFPRLNPEFVVQARPDIVIAAAGNLQGMPHRPGWDSIPALRHGRSCGFEAPRYELLVRPGPRLGEAAGQLADCLARLGVPR